MAFSAKNYSEKKNFRLSEAKALFSETIFSGNFQLLGESMTLTPGLTTFLKYMGNEVIKNFPQR